MRLLCDSRATCFIDLFALCEIVLLLHFKIKCSKIKYLRRFKLCEGIILELDVCSIRLRCISVFCCVQYQVKPLLQVTNTEEKLNKKENELRQVTEHLTHLRGEHDSLKAEHDQLTSDKMLVAEQLRAEQDLCAETEEVLCTPYAAQNSILDFVFVLSCVRFLIQSIKTVGWMSGRVCN